MPNQGQRTAGKPRVRRRLEPANRRSELKSAALRQFVSKGYKATTVDDIVRAADAAKGTFYLHFQNKKALFAELMDDFSKAVLLSFDALDMKADTVDSIPAGPVKGQAVRLLSEAYGAFFRTCRKQKPLARLFLQETLVDAELKAKRQAIYEAFADLARRSLDAGIRLGLVRPMDSRIVAHAIVGMIERVATQYLIVEPTADIDVLVRELARFEAFGILGDPATHA